MKNYRRDARIRWRRGQWATVDAFLRGEAVTRTVGPGMEEPEDESRPATEFVTTRADGKGRVLEHPDLARLDRTLR